MASPLCQCWFRADITFKHLVSAATKTLSFTNRMPIGETSTVYFPLLKSLSGLGLTVGQDGMPAESKGSIVLSDPFDSIGLERRVADLLQEYTCNEQTVTVYDAQTVITDTSPAADFSVRWVGKVKTVQKSFNASDQTLTFSVESMGIPETVKSFQLSSSNLLTGAATEEASATGKSLPIVFGYQKSEVPAVAVTTGATWKGYSSWLPTGTALGTDSYWVKAADGTYERVYPGAVTAGAFVADEASGTVGTTYPTSTAAVEYAYIIKALGATGPSSLTVGRWRFKGQGATPPVPSGNIVFTLYETTASAPWAISKQLASCTVLKSTYGTEFNGTSDFWVYFAFDNVQIRQSGKRYAISMRLTGYAGASTDFVNGGYTSFDTAYQYAANNSGAWGVFAGATTYAAVFELCCVNYAASVTTSTDGADIGTISAVQGTNLKTSAITTSVKHDLVHRLYGVTDSSGTFTGTAGLSIYMPHHVVKTLTATYSGGAWSLSSDWDWTAFASQYSTLFTTGARYYRAVSGYVEGRATLKDWLSKICSEHCCRIVQRINGKFALWAWGTTATVKKVFTDEDIEITAFNRLDSTSVINKVELYGGKGLVNYSAQTGAATGDYNNYSVSVVKTSASSGVSSGSSTIYGTKELKTVTCSLIADTTSLNTLADFYLQTHDHPHQTATFDAPYWENRSLELCDVVELLSAYLPCSGGSSLNANEGSYSGYRNNAHKGNYIKRAQRYRSEIVGSSINWSQGNIPTLSLETRILSPYHPNDPT